MTQETNLGLSSYTYMSFLQWLIYKDAQGNELHCQAAEQLSLLFVFQKRLSITETIITVPLRDLPLLLIKLYRKWLLFLQICWRFPSICVKVDGTKQKKELWIINSKSQCLKSYPCKYWLPWEIRDPVC